jgi:hypothetical protein
MKRRNRRLDTNLVVEKDYVVIFMLCFIQVIFSKCLRAQERAFQRVLSCYIFYDLSFPHLNSIKVLYSCIYDVSKPMRLLC